MRWSVGESNNLLVGNDNTAYLQLLPSASLTITGSATGIASYELQGNGVANQQNGEPLLVAQNQTFKIVNGASLTVELATNDNPVLSIDSRNGMLVVDGTLSILTNSRVVLGAGTSSISGSGVVIDPSAGNKDSNNRLYGLIDGNNEAITFVAN